MRRLPVPNETLIAFALGFILLIILLLVLRRSWRRMRRPQWEYSTIQWLNPAADEGIFFADITNAKGQPVRISSRTITLYTLQPDKHNSDHVRALNGLINGLEANGWQLLDESGKYWYSQRFRRPTR